jgi:glycosyltransferase involved in cell wall biosynthesis
MSGIDVVVPCYRYGHYLRDCVRSVLDQRGLDIRVLIIDDCSPDNTAEVSRRLVEEDRRVEFRRHAANRGHIATYNEGLLEWASAEYCLLLSADDLLTSGALSRATGVMDVHPEISMTYGRAYFTEHPEHIACSEPADWQCEILEGGEYIRRSCQSGENLVPTPTAIVRTAVQQKIGGYRSDLPHAGDMEMWLRCAVHGAIAVLDCYQAYYRTHPSSMSCRYYAGAGDLQQQRAVFQALFDTYGDRISSADRLRAAAMDALTRKAYGRASAAFERSDRALCREFIRFAEQASPVMCRSSEWRNLRLKMLLGRRVSTLVRQVLRPIRSATVANSAQ